ncbi:glycosyltransferase [Olsenella uli]|uniref:glycosyltransferase family 2 protein n=1 Tax=Olsenella uli TaxID=133926 RepID=UPI00195BC29C|nr:glycosyltransferase [Olsenella uli]
MTRLSVIVPVYNVERWADRCLGSLLSQDFDDFEVICVNDGSTDDSRQRLAAWEEKDARVRVIDQANQGPSAARNAGIRAARGDYVSFLDADDRYLPGACGRIVSALDETGSDVLVFGGRCFPDDAPCPEWLTESLHPRDVTYDAFSMDLLLREASRPFVWKLALRRDFLLARGLSLDEGLRFGEDQVFCFAVYPRSRRTTLISDELYEYQVVRDGSLMSGLRADFGSKMLEHNKVIERILADWSAGGFLRDHAADLVSFSLDFSLYDALKLDDATYRSVAEGLRRILSRYWTEADVSAMRLPRTTRRMALDACYRTDIHARARRALALEHRLRERGVRSFLRRALQKVGGPGR